MRYIPQLVLTLLFPVSIFSQGVISSGLGKIFESEYYGHIASADLTYLQGFYFLAVKSGAKLDLTKNFGLKYQAFGAAGFTSSLRKRFSGHLLIGVCYNKTYREQSKLADHIRHSASSEWILNPGLLFALKKLPGFLLGIESYAWPQVLHIGRATSHEIAASVSLTLNYRFRIFRFQHDSE